MRTAPPRRVAVIGSGVAGLTAAHVAAGSAHVTLYEADDRLGGHADTHLVDGADGRRSRSTPASSCTTSAPTRPCCGSSPSSASRPRTPTCRCRSATTSTGLEWAGALGRRGIFPTRDNLTRPAYLRMLTEIPRFHRRARALLADATGPDVTLREFLRAGGFTAYFTPALHGARRRGGVVVRPGASRWTTRRATSSRSSQHHGMLQVFGSPQWRTVTGGSRTYVERVAAGLHEVRTGTKVTSVLETADRRRGHRRQRRGRRRTTPSSSPPTPARRWRCSPSRPPRSARCSARCRTRPTPRCCTPTPRCCRAPATRWASWNFLRPTEALGHVTVTYDLTRLQRLDTDTRYLVTLGGEHLVDPATVIDRMEYEHPLYTPESVAAQRRLPSIDTDRIAFAGAYHGWGFHEDGARSGVEAAERLGLRVGEPRAGRRPPRRRAPASTRRRSGTPAARRSGAPSSTARTPGWSTSTTCPTTAAALGPGQLRGAATTSATPTASIRENLDALPGRTASSSAAGRVLMAAHPRAFGYCFNPISVFWCLDRRRRPRRHRGRGAQHLRRPARLPRPPRRAGPRDHARRRCTSRRSTAPTAPTTSPSPCPATGSHVAVSLRTDDGAVFSASLTGTPHPRGHDAPRALRAAPAALRGSLLIRAHGIWLWVRRLPVRPRPQHHQEGV